MSKIPLTLTIDIVTSNTQRAPKNVNRTTIFTDNTEAVKKFEEYLLNDLPEWFNHTSYKISFTIEDRNKTDWIY